MSHREPRFYLKIILTVLVFLLIFTYSYFRAREYIYGPQLEIIDLENGLNVNYQDFIVRGVAKNISYLTLNGLQIYTDDKGNFGRKLLLSPGYNIITIAARDKFNRTVEKSFQLTYQPAHSSTTVISDTNVATSTN